MLNYGKYLRFSPFRLLAVLLVLVFLFSSPGGHSLITAASAQSPILQKGSITVFPKGRFYKHKPSQAIIYESDNVPLGNRTPLLIVHGLRAEYYKTFRWSKLVKRLNANKDFASNFKIYFARYNSLEKLDNIVPQMQERIAELYEACGKKQIVALALSIGGNVIYECMLKPETDKQIKLLFAMGSPFHGSPLFCADWLLYGIYKNLSFPWTRIDHTIAYKLYFKRNPALIEDFRWDNCDEAIPDVGHFVSRLPFGPKGDLTPAGSVNDRMVAINKRNFDKNKLITYSGYLVNPYQFPEPVRFMENTFMFPYTLVTTGLPAFLAREHAVLKMLNRVIATVVTTDGAIKRAKTHFVYALNDGITPVISSMFLADKFCTAEGLGRENDIMKLRSYVDVRTARVFRNIDHLTYISGARPMVAPSAMQDELNPEEGSKDIFNWILHDLESAATNENLTQVTQAN